MGPARPDVASATSKCDGNEEIGVLEGKVKYELGMSQIVARKWTSPFADHCDPASAGPPQLPSTQTLLGLSRSPLAAHLLSNMGHTSTTCCTPAYPGPPMPLLKQHDAPRRVCDSRTSTSDLDCQPLMCPSPSNTTSSSSWSIEYPRALNEASESFVVPLHTFPQSYSRNMTNLYTTTSSTSMDPIENNKISSPHPDATHPASLNRATLLPENLQEDKSALTVEKRMAHIWDKHQFKEKRRKQLVL